MDVGVGGPSEDEKSDRDAKAGKKSGDETVFLCSQTILDDIWLEIEVHVRTIDDDTDYACNRDADKDDACFSEVEAVHNRVDQGKDFEIRVVDPVLQCGIDIGEQDGRVFNGDLHWNDDGVPDHCADLHAALVDFRLGLQPAVTVKCAETPSTPQEDIGRGRLRHGDEHEDKHGTRHPQRLPQRPSPTGKSS